MNKIQITVDVITGEKTISEIPFTEQELAYSAQVTAQLESEKAQSESAKASALSKLATLGLTQNEIKALIG